MRTLRATQNCFFPALAVTLSALVVGCGGGAGPETVAVTGSVVYEGQPVAGALVTFVPAASDKTLKTAQSETAEDGRFEMSYQVGNETKSGLPPGEYKVAVEKLDLESVQSTLTPPKSLLPDKYASEQTSGLSAAVQVESDNDFQFELTK